MSARYVLALAVATALVGGCAVVRSGGSPPGAPALAPSADARCADADYLERDLSTRRPFDQRTQRYVMPDGSTCVF